MDTQRGSRTQRAGRIYQEKGLVTQDCVCPVDMVLLKEAAEKLKSGSLAAEPQTNG